MTHASNVLGTILPVDECFSIAKEYGLFTLLDAAQTLGHIPVYMNDTIDVIAFTGHKGLKGLAGSGGIVWGREAAKRVKPWKTGGTGSHSDSLSQPEFMPDKFEPGTQNIPGIIALEAAAKRIIRNGFESIMQHEQSLTRRFMEGLYGLPVKVYGTGDYKNMVPVVSITAENIDPALLARRLYDEYGIITRSGLHCSPMAHRTAGTFPEGTVRFSFGKGNTIEEIDYSLIAIRKLLEGML